jgi:hypothetical protein
MKTNTDNLTDQELMDRAYRAYFRRGDNMDQPSSGSEIEVLNNTKHAVLRNCNGVLAVYKIGTKRLRALSSKEIDTWDGE